MQRNAAAGADIVTIEQKDGGVSGLRQQAQQFALALEQATQDAWYGKGPVPVRNGRENFGEEPKLT